MVSAPIDLPMIQKRLTKGEFDNNVEGFIAALKTMFDNAMKYYPSDSEVIHPFKYQDRTPLKERELSNRCIRRPSPLINW